MEFPLLLILLALGAVALNSGEQKRRIALLASHLGRYQIEPLMESLTQGYLRALGEADAERRAQIWQLLGVAELELCTQFERFVADWSQVAPADARVSRLPFALPRATRLFPGHSFDLRQALAVHARGIRAAVHNERQQSTRNRAYTLSAELFLMQHSCHWYCRSRAVASARLLARHQTSHAQVLAAVSPETRAAYLALTAG